MNSMFLNIRYLPQNNSAVSSVFVIKNRKGHFKADSKNIIATHLAHAQPPSIPPPTLERPTI